jgi:hypothetical protein
MQAASGYAFELQDVVRGFAQLLVVCRVSSLLLQAGE